MEEHIQKTAIDKMAKNLYEKAWKDYLNRTGQSSSDVQNLVETAEQYLGK